MQILTIEIAGKSFKMACGPGDEERLLSAAKVIDNMFGELKEHSPHAPNELLFVMCALQLQDQIVTMEEAKGSQPSSAAPVESNNSEAIHALDEVATKLEALAHQFKK